MVENPPYDATIRSAKYSPSEGFQQDGFFTMADGSPTIATGGDLEAAIPEDDRGSVEEVDRYWAVYPYSYISICKSADDNQYKYYVVEPHLSETEEDLIAYLTEKIRRAVRAKTDHGLSLNTGTRRKFVRERAIQLLDAYGLANTDTLRNAHWASDLGEKPDSSSRVADALDGVRGRLLGSDESPEEEDPYTGPSGLEYGGDPDHNYLPVVDGIGGHPGHRDQIVDSSEFERKYETDGPQDEVLGEEPARENSAHSEQPAETTDKPALLGRVREKVTGGSQGNSAGGDEADSATAIVTEEGYVDPTTPGLVAEDMEAFALTDDSAALTDYQAYKLLYYLERNFCGFQKIDPIKNDLNVEDISANGYNEPVFVIHLDYEQMVTNVVHGEEELDSFVTMLAQFSGKEISRRKPEIDTVLSDGSRASLVYGTEISEGGSNYTIRQFKEIPFTPIDLINWNTFSMDLAARLWLCVEHDRSIFVCGGTGAGKTTTLNVLGLFIPSTDKVVTIEDTRELELPQRNWTRLETRESEDEGRAIGTYRLIERSLRMRPNYLLMGEIRSEEEGRNVFQAMNSGHTTFSTFHASSTQQVIKRFTNEPISVPRPVFESLDLILVQDKVDQDGGDVRRIRSITEIDEYDADRDQLRIRPAVRYDAQTDDYVQENEWGVLDEIRDQVGWSRHEIGNELRARKAVLAYLILNDISEYSSVAATLQGYMVAPEVVLELIANDALEEALAGLRKIDTVLIKDIDAGEATITKPSPDEKTRAEAEDILSEAKETILEPFTHGPEWQPDPESIADDLNGDVWRSEEGQDTGDGQTTVSTPDAPTRTDEVTEENCSTPDDSEDIRSNGKSSLPPGGAVHPPDGHRPNDPAQPDQQGQQASASTPEASPAPTEADSFEEPESSPEDSQPDEVYREDNSGGEVPDHLDEGTEIWLEELEDIVDGDDIAIVDESPPLLDEETPFRTEDKWDTTAGADGGFSTGPVESHTDGDHEGQDTPITPLETTDPNDPLDPTSEPDSSALSADPGSSNGEQKSTVDPLSEDYESPTPDSAPDEETDHETASGDSEPEAGDSAEIHQDTTPDGSGDVQPEEEVILNPFDDSSNDGQDRDKEPDRTPDDTGFNFGPELTESDEESSDGFPGNLDYDQPN